MKFILLVVFATAVACSVVPPPPQQHVVDELVTAKHGPKLEWWQNTIFYQIYPRSFKDSNGDGVGDIQGIISKLDHLKELGIGGAWLSPCFKSPMVDFGYDIADFYSVDPIFGTNEDLEELFRKANALGIKIILDFVPNHSSDKSEWFIKSVNGDPEFKDYYIWHEGKTVNGKRVPPNNWVSTNFFFPYIFFHLYFFAIYTALKFGVVTHCLLLLLAISMRDRSINVITTMHIMAACTSITLPARI